MPIRLKKPIVPINPIAWPIIWRVWSLANRVTSAMLSAMVAQKPTLMLSSSHHQ
jgi:hypothetical protein